MNEGRPISQEYQALTTWRESGRLGSDDLVVWRRGEGLSQKAAGRWLGWSQEMVSCVEQGRRVPARLHERLMWGLWRYYGLVGLDEPFKGPPIVPGPTKKRRPRVKRPDPFARYEELARDSQLKTPFGDPTLAPKPKRGPRG